MMNMANVTNLKSYVPHILNQIVTHLLVICIKMPYQVYLVGLQNLLNLIKKIPQVQTFVEFLHHKNIVNETVLDLPGTECSVGIVVCSSPILGHIDSSIEITNVSGISRVACTSPITDNEVSQSLSSSCSTQIPKTLSRYTPRKIKLKELLTIQKEKV